VGPGPGSQIMWWDVLPPRRRCMERIGYLGAHCCVRILGRGGGAWKSLSAARDPGAEDRDVRTPPGLGTRDPETRRPGADTPEFLADLAGAEGRGRRVNRGQSLPTGESAIYRFLRSSLRPLF